MKNIALVLVAIALVSSLALSADMAKQGQWGVNTTLSTVNGTAAGFKFMVSENMAVRASLLFNSANSGGSNSSTTSTYGIGAGLEFHQTAVGGVSPYFGVNVGYNGVSLPNLPSGQSNPNSFSIGGVYGGEYFFSSNFSLAGDVGIQFSSVSSGVSGASAATNFGTTGVAGLTATWYLN